MDSIERIQPIERIAPAERVGQVAKVQLWMAQRKTRGTRPKSAPSIPAQPAAKSFAQYLEEQMGDTSAP